MRTIYRGNEPSFAFGNRVAKFSRLKEYWLPAKAFGEKFDWTKSQTISWWERWTKSLWISPVRDCFTSVFSFAIPATESLEAVAKLKPTMEYLSGSGYWAYLLEKEFGHKLIATDINRNHFPCTQGSMFVNVKTYDIRKQTPVDCALISWVPYESNIIDRYLRKMIPGQKIILVNEGWGGCCATDSTFKLLEDDFEYQELPLVSWYAIHDRMAVFTKVKETENG